MTRSRAPPTPQQQELEALSTSNLITFYSPELQAIHETGCWPEGLGKGERRTLKMHGLVVSVSGHRRRYGHLTLTPKALAVLLEE